MDHRAGAVAVRLIGECAAITGRVAGEGGVDDPRYIPGIQRPTIIHGGVVAEGDVLDG